MDNSLVKSKLPVAVSKINKFPIRCQHLTTTDFMDFGVALSRELPPRSHGRVSHATFLRAEPLDKPCLGSAQVHNRAFWVPFRDVWEPFSDFIYDVAHNTPSGTVQLNNVPTINNASFVVFFQTYGSSVVQQSDTYDFYDGSDYRVFTPYGRKCFKICRSLGYFPVFNDSSALPSSALPLLCLAKVYMDWYFPSAYAHYGNYASLDGIMQRQVTYTLTAAEMKLIFDIIDKVAYDNDFFTAVFDNPVGPASGTGSINFSITDDTVSSGNKSKIVQDSNGTPIVSNDGGSAGIPYRFSQYIDSSLKALTNYIVRHRLSGSRALDRALAEHGVLLNSDKLKRSVFLGDDSFPFEIGDVMSTAATSNASLGAYAGKGLGFGRFEFDFDSDSEFGYLFVISTIVPDVDYVQGIDKNVWHRFKLDFLTGEFDGLSASPVYKYELYVHDGDGTWNTNVAGDSLFGFGPRYYEYKIPYSRFTGDFVIPSINTDLNGWSTMRLFTTSQFNDNPDNFYHSLDFVLGKDSTQYDRIFLGYSDTDKTLVDPFRVVHRDEILLYAPMKHLYDVFEFEGEDNSSTVTFQPNGVRMN